MPGGTFALGGELEVGRLGYGAMRLCGPGIIGWPDDRENALAVLRRVVELGITLLDTADAYGHDERDLGHNERLIARALAAWQGDRSRITIATKGGMTRPEGRWQPCLSRPARQ